MNTSVNTSADQPAAAAADTSMSPEEMMGKLRAEGCDVEGALGRLMDDQEFYIHLLQTFYQEKSWEVLQNAMEEKDYDTAFQTAHMLKGSLATLGLMPLFSGVNKMLEDLRQKNQGFQPAKEELLEVDYTRFLRELRCFQELFGQWNTS